MSNATISSSGRTNSGTLHSVGGAGFDDYFSNLTALFDGDVGAVHEVLDEFRNVIRPVAGGSPEQSQGSSYQPRQGAGSPPGGPKLCPSHQQPAVFKSGNKNGKDWSFWKCATTDQIITDYSGNLKPNCG